MINETPGRRPGTGKCGDCLNFCGNRLHDSLTGVCLDSEEGKLIDGNEPPPDRCTNYKSRGEFIRTNYTGRGDV